jgi:hypothetical protein
MEAHTKHAGPWRVVPTPSGRLIHAPKRSTTTFRDDDWGYEVEITLAKDTHPLTRFVSARLPQPLSLTSFRCDAITIRPRGRPLTASVVHRVRTAALIKSAVLAAIEIGEVDDDGHIDFPVISSSWLGRDPTADAEALSLLLRAAPAKRRRGRRKNISDDQLPEVAKIYRDSTPSGHPTQAVENHFNLLSHATAA